MLEPQRYRKFERLSCVLILYIFTRLRNCFISYSEVDRLRSMYLNGVLNKSSFVYRVSYSGFWFSESFSPPPDLIHCGFIRTLHSIHQPQTPQLPFTVMSQIAQLKEAERKASQLVQDARKGTALRVLPWYGECYRLFYCRSKSGSHEGGQVRVGGEDPRI